MKTEKKKNENIIEIQEEVRISQGDQEVILEKGDKIQVLKELSVDTRSAEILARGLDNYFTNRFDGPINDLYDPGVYPVSEIAEIIATDFAWALSRIPEDGDPILMNYYKNYKNWADGILKIIGRRLQAGNYLI